MYVSIDQLMLVVGPVTCIDGGEMRGPHSLAEPRLLSY